MASTPDTTPRPRTIDTEDLARRSPYHSPVKGFHAHSIPGTLIPTDSCHLCKELRRRQSAAAIPEDDGGEVQEIV